jgi:hypothetical protein
MHGVAYGFDFWLAAVIKYGDFNVALPPVWCHLVTLLLPAAMGG